MIELKKDSIFASALGEVAEWSNALVLKTSEGHTSGGSNPSFSAETMFQKKHKIEKPFKHQCLRGFLFLAIYQKALKSA